MVAVESLRASGCRRCEQRKEFLTGLVAMQQAQFPALRFTVVDVRERPELAASHSLMATPGMAIDGRLEFQGRVPSERELVAKLREHAREA